MLPALPNLKNGYSYSTSSHLKTLSLLLQGHLSTPHLLQIHARIFRIHADQDNLVATRLIGHYPPPLALRVFHHLQNPNIFPSNAILRILSENGFLIQVFSVFKTLKNRSLSPNDFTLSFLLKACFRSNDARNIQQIHTHVVKLGFDCNSSVCNGLLAVYAKGVRDIVSAHKLFDEMPQKGMVFSWTCLIAGYAQLNRSEEVLTLFLRMIREKLVPEDDTMVSILSACSNIEIQEIERWVRVLSEFGTPDDKYGDVCCDSVDTVLVYLYGKWGKIDKSMEVFDKITDRGEVRRSVLPWNTIIGCYTQNSRPIEALCLFRLMVAEPSPRPNHVTMVNVLSSCAQVGDLELGRWVHKYMKKNKGTKSLIETNTILATAFIDMYSKCGDLRGAIEVFDGVVIKDLVSFNAMIMGFAINGEGKEALKLFTKMEQISIHPNTGTFLGLLSACNHSGLVDEGRRIFREMGQKFLVVPELEHYSCYTDLLARFGHIDEALEVVSSMAIEPNSLVWGALLGGCLVNSRFDVARDIAKRIVKDLDNSGGYVMLSNLYAKDRRWSEILELRGMMREKGVRKQPGCSWISIDGVVHEFLVGSTSHPQIQRIFYTLQGLFNEMRSLSY